MSALGNIASRSRRPCVASGAVFLPTARVTVNALRKREIVGPPAEGPERRPLRAEARARLLEALAKARLWLDGLIVGRFTSTAEIARHERCSERAVRITLSLEPSARDRTS